MFFGKKSTVWWLSLIGVFFASLAMTTVPPASAKAASLTDPLTTNQVFPVMATQDLPTNRPMLRLAAATATSDTAITGTFGSSPWSLDGGVLTIGAGDFASRSPETSPWATYKDQITTIDITGPVSFNTTSNGLFAGLPNLTAIHGLDKVDTSETTSIKGLFQDDSQLTDLTGIEHWQTSKIKSIDRAFFAIPLIGILDLSHWDVSSLTTTGMAFGRTGALENGQRLFQRLDLSGWNFKASSVNLATFGYQLQALVVDTSGWENTNHITSMESMFTFSALNELDMRTFDMSGLVKGGSQKMFQVAFALKQLKLGPYANLSGTGLGGPTASSKYTGYWQNIGTGTPTTPNGDQVLTNSELVAKYDGTGSAPTDTFVWQLKDAQPVTVQYRDAADPEKVVKPDTQITGIIEDPFTVTPPEIANYSYQGVKDDVALTGAISGEAQTITLLYAKYGQVTIKSQTTDGKSLGEPKVISGAVDSAYTIEPPTIDDYTYESASASLTGTYTTSPQTITLTYKAKPQAGVVKVNYQDEAGKELAEPKTLTGTVGTTYTIEQPTISGYTYLSGDLTGTFTTNAQNVTLTYRKIPTEGQVTVNYLDAEGHVLAAPQTMTGPLGTDYRIEPKTIDGYTYQSGNLTGTYTTTNHTVNLIYQKKVAQGTVTVTYEDETGHQLADATTVTGPVGQAYTLTKKSIAGYTFQTGPLTGTFTASAQTVVHKYRKDAAAQGSVTVNYQDEHGKTLAPSDKLAGPIDSPYTVSQKVIADYTYHHATGALTGKFSQTSQNVTLVYQPTKVAQGQVTVKYQTTDGQTLGTDTLLTGDIETDYTIEPLKFAGYTYAQADHALTGKFDAKPLTIKLTYKPDSPQLGQVIVNYLDLAGQAIASPTTLTGQLTTGYTTKAKSINGYTYAKTVGNPTGTFTSQPQAVSYFYQKQTAAKDQRELTGQAYTMTVNGSAPTASDFKAHAKDRNGQSIPAQVDLGQANLKKVGTYTVTLKTSDGQTLAVNLFVIAAAETETEQPQEESAGDTINSNSRPESVSPTTTKPKTKPQTNPITGHLSATTVGPSTKTNPTRTNTKLPATGEKALGWGALIGVLSLISLGLTKLIKRL